MVLSLSASGIHADPNATGEGPTWPATHYDQANDIMQAKLPPGVQRRLNDTDALVLDNAFGWAASGIQIAVVNVGNSMSLADLALVESAVADVNKLFPVRANKPVFTWRVAEVPEPPSVWLLVVGSLTILFMRARRGGAADHEEVAIPRAHHQGRRRSG